MSWEELYKFLETSEECLYDRISEQIIVVLLNSERDSITIVMQDSFYTLERLGRHNFFRFGKRVYVQATNKIFCLEKEREIRQ